MRAAFACAAGVVALAVTGSATAQEFKPPPLFAPPSRPAKPPKVDWNWRPQAEPSQPAKPSVICGMTVIPADPKIDPKMALKPPDKTTWYTVKVVEPTVCKP
jgi:hypothetical protein